TGWVVGMIDRKDPSKSSDQNAENKLVVLHTIDGGKHWRQQFAKDYAAGTVGSVDIDFVNATTGWFLTSDLGTWNDELYYTANAGKDWQKISQIRSARPSPTEVKFITPQVGWIPLDVGAGPISGGLMLTKDGGKDFTIVGNEDEMSSNREVDFISEQQGWVVATAPSQGDYLMHTGDGGQTWTQVYPKVRPTKDISFVDNQHGFGLGQLSDSGVLLYTADGGDTWKDIYNFSEKFRPRKLSFVNRNMGWVLGTSLNSEKTVILKTTDAGSSWTPLDVDITQQSPYFTSCFRFFDPNNGIIVADHFNVFRTQDGGRSWQVSTQELSIASFISLRQGWEILSSGSKPNTVGLSQMKDGATWQALGQISSNAWPIGIDFISSDKGFILLEEPAFQLDSRVKLLVTTNGGRTWSSHQFPQGLIIETLESAIPIQFTDDQHGWILSTQGLLRTRDGGKTWTWD
ncbi:MAG TPA: YCF48-related protein, partial [Desulfosporosinus sp.]|nr:YCF48-related protein [Desulfosporosinus sp.]